MALGRENTPASNGRDVLGVGELRGTEALEQRLADSLVGMGCDGRSEMQRAPGFEVGSSQGQISVLHIHLHLP